MNFIGVLGCVAQGAPIATAGSTGEPPKASAQRLPITSTVVQPTNEFHRRFVVAPGAPDCPGR